MLEVMVNGQTMLTTTVGSDGRWQVPLSLTAGASYTVEVTHIDEDGSDVAATSSYRGCRHSYSNSDEFSHQYAVSHAYTDANIHCDGNSRPNCDQHAHGDSYAKTN